MSTPRAAKAGSDILHVKVGESLEEAGERATQTLKMLQRGAVPAPCFGISFAKVGAMFAAFTPRRLELIAALRESGPLTVAELARRLKRNYKNVHTDVNHLIEWMAVERDEKGRVGVPWSGITVELKLPQRQLA